MKYFHLLLVLAISVNAFAQSCTHSLSGKITDFHDGKPIDGATIYFPNLNKYTTTNSNGEFVQGDLCNGTILLSISHVSCETLETTILISGDTYKEFSLEHHIEQLGEVTVKATVNNPETQTGQLARIEKQEIVAFSGATLGDAIKQINGVNAVNTGNSIVKPVINGMHSSRVLIVNNNVRLQDQEWGIEHAPNLDLNIANNITVIKGSGALAYGSDAIGGIVLVNPERTILKDTLYGNAIVNGQTNGRGGSFTSSLKRNFKSGWFVHGNATVKKLGDFKAPDYNLTNTSNQTIAFSLNGGFRSFKQGFNAYYSYIDNRFGILQASHVGNVNDLLDALESQEPLVVEDFDYTIEAPRQEVTHHLVKLDYFRRFKSFGKVQLQYDYQNNQRFEFDRRIGEARNRASVDLNLQTHSLLADLILDTNADESLKTGLLMRYQNNFADPDTGVRRIIPDYDKYDLGAYMVYEKSLENDIILDVGLRYDYTFVDAKKFYLTSRWEERGYQEDFADFIIEDIGTQLLTNPEFTYNNMAFSAGFKKSYDNQELRIQYALAGRAPNPAELFSDGLHHSSARIELGDLRIGQEWSNRLGVSYSLNTKTVNLNTELFANRINGYIYLRPDRENPLQQSNRGAFPVWEYVQNDAFFAGLDVSGSIQLAENIDLSNKASYLFVQDLDDDIPMIDIPGFTNTATIRFVKPSWMNFRADIQNETVLMQNRFPDNNYTVLNPTTGEDVFVDISTPPASYSLVHANVGITVPVNQKSDLNVSLGIQNILNTNYRNYLNRQRFFADELGRNFKLQLQVNF